MSDLNVEGELRRLAEVALRNQDAAQALQTTWSEGGRAQAFIEAANLVAAHTPARLPQAEAQGPARAATDGLRKALDWPRGEFSVFDPDPTDLHGALYLVCPDSLAVNLSCHVQEGMDAARGEWMARVLNAALSTGPSASGEAGRERCERCQGNGEIVTDWQGYLHPPHQGAEADHGTADCPDCDGLGFTNAALSTPPTPATEPETHAADEERGKRPTFRQTYNALVADDLEHDTSLRVTESLAATVVKRALVNLAGIEALDPSVAKAIDEETEAAVAALATDAAVSDAAGEALVHHQSRDNHSQAGLCLTDYSQAPHAPATGASSGLTAEEQRLVSEFADSLDLCAPNPTNGQRMAGILRRLISAARRPPVDGDGGAS